MLFYWLLRVASVCFVAIHIIEANNNLTTEINFVVFPSEELLIADEAYNITCEVTNGKELPSNTTVRYGGCNRTDTELFELPTVSRSQNAVTGNLRSEWLQHNGQKMNVVFLACCCDDSGERTKTYSIKAYEVSAPLNAPNVSLLLFAGIEQNTLLVQVVPSTDSQKDKLSVQLVNIAVERRISVRYTLMNGSTIIDECTTTNYCTFVSKLQLDTNVQVEVNVTDSLVYVGNNGERKQMQSAMSQSKASLGELMKLRSLETFNCAATTNTSGSLDFSWHDTRLSSVRDVQVTSWVDCDCNLLSASGRTVPAGHYNATVVNLACDSATLRLAVASGAACECTLKRRFGESAFVSDDQKVSCESLDDYTSVEPLVVLEMQRQQPDREYQVFGAHIQQPTIEQLNGVAVTTRLRLFELVNSTEKSLYGDLVVSSNKTYFQLPYLLASKSYLLQVQVATRRGYNDKNQPTELVIKGRNNQDEQPALQCTNAVSVNTDLKALEFRVRCTEGDGMSLRGKRFRFVLSAIACFRVSMNSQDCSNTMLVATKTLRNASFSELNQAVVRMSLASNEETLMLFNSIKSSLQNEMILMGVSISVADEESGDWLLTNSLMELKCAYYSNEPVTDLDLSADGTNSSVKIKLSRCSSLAYGKRGLVNQLKVFAREANSNGFDYQQVGSVVVPFASDSDVDLDVPLDGLSTDVTYELTVNYSSFGEGNSQRMQLIFQLTSNGLQWWLIIVIVAASCLLLVSVAYLTYRVIKKRFLAADGDLNVFLPESGGKDTVQDYSKCLNSSELVTAPAASPLILSLIADKHGVKDDTLLSLEDSRFYKYQNDKERAKLLPQSSESVSSVSSNSNV